ncbi:MAG: hypothetical protein Q7S92_02365 [Candidatus Diapherotrites archaeon]|nr:hypothetical protein [Candidatus Diapherotrites archaeon]
MGDALEDFLVTRHDFDPAKKEFLHFSVSQICLVNEKVRTIIRYDSSHGFSHVHRFTNT